MCICYSNTRLYACQRSSGPCPALSPARPHASGHRCPCTANCLAHKLHDRTGGEGLLGRGRGTVAEQPLRRSVSFSLRLESERTSRAGAVGPWVGGQHFRRPPRDRLAAAPSTGTTRPPCPALAPEPTAGWAGGSCSSWCLRRSLVSEHVLCRHLCLHMCFLLHVCANNVASQILSRISPTPALQSSPSPCDTGLPSDDGSGVRCFRWELRAPRASPAATGLCFL